MDPDLLGGDSCVLLQLLKETLREQGRLANEKQHSKTILDRIENWSITKPRVDVVSCSLLKKNLDIEVLKKAQALVSGPVRETLELNIAKCRAEANEWKVELLKGIVFKMMRDMEGLEEAAALETEALRLKLQECERKNEDIQAARREAAGEPESTLAAMAEKAKEDELRIESLERQLAEKSNASKMLESKVKETVTRVATSIKAMTRKAADDESRIQQLQNQLAVKGFKETEVPEIVIRHTLGQKKLESADDKSDVARKRTTEDLLFMPANEDLKKDVEEFPAAKRTKRKGATDDFTSVKVVGDEEIRRAVVHILGQKELERTDNKLGMARKRAKEDLLFLLANEDVQEDVEDLPAAKRTKWKGEAENFTRVKVAGDEEIRRVVAHILGQTVSERADNKLHTALKRAKEDLLFLLANKDFKEDLEDFPAAKWTTWNGGPENTARVKVAGDENKQEAAKQQSVENGRKNVSAVNDSVNHVKTGVGASSGEAEVIRRLDQIPQERAPGPTPSAPSAPSAEPHPNDTDVILVPDPDFHDFDLGRTETHILPGQIWALYDDQDGMPRFYARIARVTTKPFMAHLNWVERCPSAEKEREWTRRTGLSSSCGDFTLGKAHIIDTINMFSHVVMNQTGRGPQKIYPKIGQVWAVYNDPAEGRSIHPKFEMVKILSEYSGEKGLKIRKLLKVKGFTSVFHSKTGIDSIRIVKPEELFKFSHGVPSHRIEISQTDAFGIPRGSLELDPASTSIDLSFCPSDPSTVND